MDLDMLPRTPSAPFFSLRLFFRRRVPRLGSLWDSRGLRDFLEAVPRLPTDLRAWRGAARAVRAAALLVGAMLALGAARAVAQAAASEQLL